jgi:hypothetical protein
MSDLYDDPAHGSDSVAIDDPDDLHRVRRVEAIHKARQNFVTVRLKARERVMTDKFFTRPDADRYAVLTALDYLRELEPMIRRSESDILDREITIQSRRVAPEQVATDGISIDEQSLQVGPITVTLQQLLDQGGDVVVDATARGTDSFSGVRKTREFSATLRPGDKHALRIVRLCDDFIEEVLPSIRGGDQEAELDYSDLL